MEKEEMKQGENDAQAGVENVSFIPQKRKATSGGEIEPEQNQKRIATKGGKDADKNMNLKLQCELIGHEHPVACVKFSGNGKLLATCGADKTVMVWDSELIDGWTSTGEKKSLDATIVFEGHSAGVNDVSWDPTSKFLVSASDDKTLIVWSIEEKKQVLLLEGHTTYVFCCCFNPQGTIIASGSFDETIRMWEAKSGKCLRELPAHSDPVTSVDFNRDGSMIVSSSHDGLCRVWDSANGHCLKTLIDDSSPPVAFARFSPNGQYILIGALDNQIRLWSFLDSGKCMKTYKGHKNEKYCIFQTFLIPEDSSKSKCVVSGSEDNAIVIWDLNSKKILQYIGGKHSNNNDGHSGPVLAVSAYKSWVASGGFDKVVKIWA